MNNVKFNCLYRDASNYKVHGSIIFSNPENIRIVELENKLRSKLIDSEFFDPDNFKIPCLVNNQFPFDKELDHLWNEFVSLELTDELPLQPRSFFQFLEQIMK